MKTAWTVLLVVLALIGSACTGPIPTPTESTTWNGQVGEAPVTAKVGDVVVTFPAGVSAAGTRATVSVVTTATPAAPKGATLVSPVVAIALDAGQQPQRPVTISLPVNDPTFTATAAPGQRLVIASAVGADGAESFMQGVVDKATGSFTFTTDHFSDFKVFGFDVGAALDAAKTAILQGLGLEMPAPDCVDKPVTINGTRYGAVSTAQTYLCVGADDGNLVVTGYPATAIPFRVTSRPTADAVTEATQVSVMNAGLIGFARALKLIDSKGVSAAFDGARARLTFKGTPASVHLSLNQYPVLLLMAIFAKTLDVLGITTIERLQKIEWVQCLGGANETVDLIANGRNGEALGSWIRDALSCVGLMGDLTAWARVVLAALTAAPTFLASSILGTINELTGQASYEVSLNVTVPRPTSTIALGEGGSLTLNGTTYGRGGPKEIHALTKALGQPDKTKTVTCQATPMTQRRWGNLIVYSVNKAVNDEASPAHWEAGGISGWLWDSNLDGGQNGKAAIKGPRGITFGTTGATIKAIYSKIDIFNVWTEGDIIIAFAGDTTSAEFLMTKAGRLHAVRAGIACR